VEKPRPTHLNLLALKVSFKPAPFMGHSEAHLYPGDACGRARGAARRCGVRYQVGVHRRPPSSTVLLASTMAHELKNAALDS
jgi:hypothetical protein